MPSSLDRGLLLLEILVRARKPMTFGALCEALADPSRATLSRTLKALVASGHVHKDPATGLYGPGYRMAAFAAVRTEGRGAFLIARYGALMESVCASWEVTSILLERVLGALVNVRKLQTQTSAFMQEEGYINDQPGQPWTQLLYAYAPETMPPGLPRELCDALPAIREAGSVYDDQELRPHFRRLGFPLLDADGALIGAFGIGGNVLHLTDDLVPRIRVEVGQRIAEIRGQG